MTNEQVDIIQQSWNKIKPVMQFAGELFYKNLFDMAPQVRHMFKADISGQATRLMATLTYVVDRLKNIETIIDDVKKLGAKHNDYGAEPAHYAVVRECLLLTLSQGLGDEWNPKLKEAWAQGYDVVAGAMMEAQRNAKLKAAS